MGYLRGRSKTKAPPQTTHCAIVWSAIGAIAADNILLGTVDISAMIIFGDLAGKV